MTCRFWSSRCGCKRRVYHWRGSYSPGKITEPDYLVKQYVCLSRGRGSVPMKNQLFSGNMWICDTHRKRKPLRKQDFKVWSWFFRLVEKQLLGSDQNATLSARIDSMHKRRMRVMSLAAQNNCCQFIAASLLLHTCGFLLLLRYSCVILFDSNLVFRVTCHVKRVECLHGVMFFHGWTSRCSYCSCPPEEQWPSGGIITSQVSL